MFNISHNKMQVKMCQLYDIEHQDQSKQVAIHLQHVCLGHGCLFNVLADMSLSASTSNTLAGKILTSSTSATISNTTPVSTLLQFLQYANARTGQAQTKASSTVAEASTALHAATVLCLKDQGHTLAATDVKWLQASPPGYSMPWCPFRHIAASLCNPHHFS